ncbi:MAG: AsmA-like C-terminal region-containing protein [Flavobacteriales bacterium]
MGRTLRILRNSLLIVAGLFALLFGILCYILYAHEQEIADEVIARLNEGQQGKMSFERVELSPFRNFPYISIDLKGLRFNAGKDTVNDHAIFAFADVYLGFDVFDILRGEYTIRKLVLSRGHLYLEKHTDGTYNIDRALFSAASEEEEGSAHLDLQRIELREVTLHEVNRMDAGKELVLDITSADAYLRMVDDQLRMGLESELFLQQYTAGTTTWFREFPFRLSCDMTIDEGLVTIHPSTFAVDAGELDLHGTLDLNKDLLLDLKVSGNKKNFDTFIAFAPPDVLAKLKEFKNEGDIFFDGTITGAIDKQDPLIDLRLGCKNTVFHHKSHNKALRDVAFTGHFRTGDDGGLDKAYLELVNLYGEPEKGLMKGTIRVDNLLDPRITMDFHANFDLAHLKTFYDLEAIEHGSGAVTIDITLNEYVGPDSVLHFATKMTDGVTSNIAFTDVELKLASLNKAFTGFNGKILLDGDDLTSKGLRVRIGQSDLALDFGLSNVSALFHHQSAPVDLRLHGESRTLHMAELLALNGKEVDTPWARDTISGLAFDVDVHTTVDALEHARYLPTAAIDIRHLELRTAKYPHTLDDVRGRIAVSDEQLHVDDLTFTLSRNDVHASVLVDNFGALLDSTRRETVTHRTALRSSYFNAKELLVYDGQPFIHNSIEEEVVRDLVLEGSGTMQSNTFTNKGFISNTHIDRFTVRVNDLPPLKELDGRVLTDTSGCITLQGLKLAMGRSDLTADLYLRQFLDDDLVNKHIEGRVRSSNLDLDELSQWSPATDTTAHGEAFNLFALPFPVLKLTADIGHLRQHRMLLDDLHAEVRTTKDHRIHVDSFSLRAAGGSMHGNGLLDGRQQDSIVVHGRMHVKDVELDKVMFKLDNFGQDVLVHDNLHGRVTGSLTLDGHLHPDLTPDLTPDLGHTTVVADLRVEEGRLTRFAPMHAMALFMDGKDLDNIRFGELENRFTFTDGTLHVPEMKISSTLGYMHLSGRQNMDLSMDYTLRLPLDLVRKAGWSTLRNKLRSQARREELALIEQTEAEIISEQKGLIKGYLTVRITGTPDDFEVHMGKGDKKE